METVCVCREIFLILGRQYSGSGLELNEYIWPRLQAQGMGWAEMKETLAQLVEAQLVLVSERLVAGNRMASFYQLSELGWQELRGITEKPKGKKGNANATSCGKNSRCFNKAA